MFPKAIAVAVLSSIAIAAGGCGGGSDAEAEGPSATTTEQVETQPSTQAGFDIAKFRTAFKETYGTPPSEMQWYGLVTGMKMRMDDQALLITTKLDPMSPFAQDNAGAICGAAVKLAIDLGVLGGDGIAYASVRRFTNCA